MFAFHTQVQHWINRTAIALRIEAQQQMARAGIDLSAEEWAILMVLWSRGDMATSALAELTLKDRTTVTRLADRLLKKGYVTRQTPKEDRRSVVVSVTEKGAQLEPQVMAVMLALIAKSEKGISQAELTTTRETLEKLFANLTK